MAEWDKSLSDVQKKEKPMTKPTTPLIDVLKAAMPVYHVLIAQYLDTPSIKQKLEAELSQLNAHIAWRESGECVEGVRSAIFDALCVSPVKHSYEYIAKATIKAMEGSND
jgi:hypothetical protein